MFGFGKAKPKQADPASPEKPQTPSYNVEDEVVFHVMPSKFKKEAADAKTAQKTGIFIMIGGGLFVLALFVAAGWYFLNVNTGKTAIKKQTSILIAEENAPTTTPLVETPAAPVSQLATSSDVSSLASTTSDAAATSSNTNSNGNSSDVSILLAQQGIASSDADGDGLSDAEETLLGSDKDKTDSDGDGFSDFAEFSKDYNPAGKGKLIDSGLMALYDSGSFSLVYPKSWVFKAAGNDSVYFDTNAGQLIKVSTQANTRNESIANWYQEQFSSEQVSSEQMLSQTDASGRLLWQGIKSKNGLSVFMTDPETKTIVSMNYDLGAQKEMKYKEIFSYMVNSFRLK